MKKVINVSGEKVEIIKKLAKGKGSYFMYLDPPYYPVNPKNPYNLYSAGCNYSPTEFLKLKLRCDELTKAKIPFLMNMSDVEFMRILFKDYIIVDINEPRCLKNKKGTKTPKEKCLIITNFERKEDFMDGIDQMNKIVTK